MSWVIWRVFRKMKIIFGFTCSTSFPLSSTRTVSPPEVSQFVGQYVGSWFWFSLVTVFCLFDFNCLIDWFDWFWVSPVTVFSLWAIVSTVQDANSVLHREILRNINDFGYWQKGIYSWILWRQIMWVAGFTWWLFGFARLWQCPLLRLLRPGQAPLPSLSDRYLKTRVTFDLLSRALARQMSCLCPRLKPAPPSDTLCSSPPDSSATWSETSEEKIGTRTRRRTQEDTNTSSVSPALWIARCKASSEKWLPGSRLKRRLPENRVGS